MKKTVWGFCFLMAGFLSCNERSEKENTVSMQETINRVPWRHTTNVYEVNLRQYTPEGSIRAFMKEMPRLKEMGVETLWFMPITPIAKKEMKGSMGSYYACSDYTAVAEEFGTLEDFRSLVEEAHQLGLKVILDWVANHTGWDHVWTREHPDWYEHDSSTNDFKRASGMDDIIELDFKNQDMRNAMIDAMKFWVKECDIDGFRCDLAFWVELDFWEEARPQVDSLKPLFWLAELDPTDHPEYMRVFDAAYSWTWMHKTRDYYNEHQPILALDTLLSMYDTIVPKDAIVTWFTTNHDENSWNGTEYEKYGDMAIPLAVFSCTWNGMPLVYSGQEMPNHKRLAFFDKDPIEWTGNYDMAGFYKTLLNLHSTHPALRAADDAVSTYRLRPEKDINILAYLRKNGDREVVVILNLSRNEEHFQLENQHLTGVYSDVFSNEQRDFTNDRSVSLKPWGWVVYQR